MERPTSHLKVEDLREAHAGPGSPLLRQ
jgi:hypothetical protein